MPPVRDPIVVKAHTRKRPTPKKKVSAPSSDAAQGYGLKRANAFKKTPQFNRDQQAAATAGVKYELDKLKRDKQLKKPEHHDNIFERVLHTVYGHPGKGGSHAAAARGTSLTMSGPVRAATNLGMALGEDPIHTSKHTVSGLAKTALNVPGGLAHAATQSPAKTLKEIGADYAKRYGETDVQMRKRFIKEGAAPELLDALAAYGGGGAALGKLAKGSDLMSAARPALRTGGGAARAQDVSTNLFHAATQRALDKARASRTAKTAGRTSYEEDLRAPAHVVEAHRANQAAGRVVEVAPLHGADKAQRVGVAKLKSRAVQMLKSEQHRRVEQHARPIINQLDKHERKAFYAVAEGWAPADASRAVAHLQKRKADILHTRQAEGIDSVRRKVDEVHKIDNLIKHAHEAFTPKVGAAVRALRKQDIHVGRNDPALSAAQRLLTRYGPQANHLGLRRGEHSVGEDEHIANLRRQLREMSHDDPRRADVEAQLASSQEELDHLRSLGGKPPVHAATPLEKETRLHLADAQDELDRHMRLIQGLRERVESPEGAQLQGHLLRERLSEMEDEAKALRGERDAALKAWRKHRTHDPHVDLPPNLAYSDESVPNFIKRVQHEADKHGLSRPLYFPHEADALSNNPDFASRAVGGSRAVNAPKQRQYKLFNRGTRDTAPEVYLTGLARSIKRKHNWNLVADQFERNTMPGLANMTLGQLKKELTHRGIDAKDAAYWNPGRFRRALKDGEVPTHERPNRYGDATTPAEELGAEQLGHALTEATHPGHELAQTKGWAAIPKAAHDEIMAAATPQKRTGRSIDIFNGKQARLLLGLNPAWNAFQVASNAGLGTLATQGRLPLRLIQQKRVYDRLSPEARDRFDALVGEGAGTHGAQVHLGATAKGPVTGRYRNFKAKPGFDKPVAGGPTPRQLNPLEAGFAFDRFQNKHFRRAVLLDEIKKQAHALDPKTVESFLRDPVKAEHAAEKMDDWLGDYTSYTHRERMGIKKIALFYGYLRHSLTVLFKTLPIEHPIMASILGKLGQLQADELKKLGLDGLPWANGKFYFTAGGQPQSVDLGRANPVANAVTQIHGVGDLLGLTQPAVQILNDQINHRNSFKDKSWAVGGRPASATSNLKGSYFDKFRPRVLVNQIGELSPVYRDIEKLTMFGPQGVDSLPWSQRPTTYKRADYKLAMRKQAEQDRKDSSLLHVLAPFLPHPSHDAEVAKSIKNNAPAKKKPKDKSYFHKTKGYKFG